MFTSSKWVFKPREEWHKSNVSAWIGVLKHLQTCHYCSSWNEHQKSGRSPTVTFRKLSYHHFDISNSLRFKHAAFEDLQFLENVKNNTDTLLRGGFAYVLSNSFLDEIWCCPTYKQKNVSVLFLFCGLSMHLSNYHSKTMINIDWSYRYSLWCKYLKMHGKAKKKHGKHGKNKNKNKKAAVG